jgi:hypothetical protein
VTQRVELHPATDRWMRGDRYGTVIGEVKARGGRPLRYRVRMDVSGDVIQVREDDIGRWL